MNRIRLPVYSRHPQAESGHFRTEKTETVEQESRQRTVTLVFTNNICYISHATEGLFWDTTDFVFFSLTWCHCICHRFNLAIIFFNMELKRKLKGNLFNTTPHLQQLKQGEYSCKGRSIGFVWLKINKSISTEPTNYTWPFAQCGKNFCAFLCHVISEKGVPCDGKNARTEERRSHCVRTQNRELEKCLLVQLLGWKILSQHV